MLKSVYPEDENSNCYKKRNNFESILVSFVEEDISVVKSAENRHRNKRDDDWTVINGKIQSRSSTNETWDCRIQEIEKIKKNDVWSFSLDELKAKKDNKADWSVEIGQL